jgi:RNA polymerase sigma factor (sigma-70 family)
MSHKDWKPCTTENYNYLYHYALKKLDDTALIQDLIQDTFLVALENYDRFEQRSSELTWLTAILKYKIYKVYHCRSRCKRVLLDEVTEEMTTPGFSGVRHRPVQDHSEQLIFKEFSQKLSDYMVDLPILWQQVYDLRFVKGEKSSEICNQLNLSSANYWVICHRLKLSLKKWYIRNWQ